MAQDYSKSKKIALRTIILLGIITVVEVFIALIGKGHLIHGFHIHFAVMGLAMIALSLYKAYKIVFEFMHLGHEVGGMAFTVMLPTLLLVWGVIAFLMEGEYWKDTRQNSKEKTQIEQIDTDNQQGMLLPDPETKYLF